MDLLDRESYPGAFMGFRAFRWYEGKLRSLSATEPPDDETKHGLGLAASPYGWNMAGETAACQVEGADHDAPASGCSCGLWAYKSLDDLLTEPLILNSQNMFSMNPAFDRAPVVIAMVAAWGRVMLHTKGMRAEHMRPVAFVDVEVSRERFTELLMKNCQFRLDQFVIADIGGGRSYIIPKELRPSSDEYGIEWIPDEKALEVAGEIGLTTLEEEKPLRFSQFYNRRSGRITFEEDLSGIPPSASPETVFRRTRGCDLQKLPAASGDCDFDLSGVERFEVGRIDDEQDVICSDGIAVWAYEGFPFTDTSGTPALREAHEDLARDVFRLLEHSGAGGFRYSGMRDSMAFYMGYVRSRYSGLYCAGADPRAQLEGEMEQLASCEKQIAAVCLAIAGERRAGLDSEAREDFAYELRVDAQTDRLFDRYEKLRRVRERVVERLQVAKEEVRRYEAHQREARRELEERLERMEKGYITPHKDTSDRNIGYLDTAAAWHSYQRKPQNPQGLPEALARIGRRVNELLDSLKMSKVEHVLSDAARQVRCCGISHRGRGKFFCRRVFDSVVRGARRAWGWCVHLVTESPGKISRLRFSRALPENSNSHVADQVRMEG